MAAASLPHHPLTQGSSQRLRRRTVAAATTSAPSAPITLVASDVDGTMLDSAQRLSERVIQAVQKCEASGVPVRKEWRERERERASERERGAVRGHAHLA